MRCRTRSRREAPPLLAAVDALLAATGRDRACRLTEPLLMPTLMVGREALTPGRAAPYVLAWAGRYAYLWPRTGRDRLPVLIHSTALLGTAPAARDTGDRAVAADGTLFLVSDTLLALERFGDVHLPAHESLVMTTCTSGQALLARSSR